MWTEARIVIINHRIPGGPQTVLGPAGCGPDVAVPDETAFSTVVTLDERDERLPRLLNLLAEYENDWLERRRDRFTDEEFESARLIAMSYDVNARVFGGPREGTTYDMSEACKLCGAGARQTSAMVLDPEYLHLLEGRRAATTHDFDLLVDEKLAGALAQSGATGLSFRGVFAAFERRGQASSRKRPAPGRGRSRRARREATTMARGPRGVLALAPAGLSLRRTVSRDDEAHVPARRVLRRA